MFEPPFVLLYRAQPFLSIPFLYFSQKMHILRLKRREAYDGYQQRRLLRRDRLQVQPRRHALRTDDDPRWQYVRLRTLHLLRQLLQALKAERKEGIFPLFLYIFAKERHADDTSAAMRLQIDVFSDAVRAEGLRERLRSLPNFLSAALPRRARHRIER